MDSKVGKIREDRFDGDLLSLKLTARTSKLIVGRLLSFWISVYFYVLC